MNANFLEQTRQHLESTWAVREAVDPADTDAVSAAFIDATRSWGKVTHNPLLRGWRGIRVEGKLRKADVWPKADRIPRILLENFENATGLKFAEDAAGYKYSGGAVSRRWTSSDGKYTLGWTVGGLNDPRAYMSMYLTWT
jgi:hypothetical protein